MAVVRDGERRRVKSVPSRGLFFHTPGGNRVLVPWGGEGRVTQKIDATDPSEVSDALIASREMVLAEADRLRASVPGFENATVSLMADQLGITESRRLQGEYVMTREDLDHSFGDAIARTGHWTKYDCVYNIPYRSLLPQRPRQPARHRPLHFSGPPCPPRDQGDTAVHGYRRSRRHCRGVGGSVRRRR